MTSTLSIANPLKSSKSMALELAKQFTALPTVANVATLSTPSPFLPLSHANALLADLSSLVTNIHLNHARYSEIDIANAQLLVSGLATAPDLTNKESEALERIKRQVLDKDWRRISGTVAAPVAYYQKLSNPNSNVTGGGDEAGDEHGDEASSGAAWGKATAIIDTSADSVFSYLWNYNSYERRIEHELKEKGMLHEEVPLSVHSKIYIRAISLPGNLDDR